MRGTSLGIAGIGLIGGSIALRAHAAGATVIGYDRDPDALRAATAAGALDATASSLEELAERASIVALALPVDATVAALGTPALDRPQLVFDVASVKVPIAAAAAQRTRFVASHPLAGREVGGFGSAEAGLFEGRTWAIVPSHDAALQAQLEQFVIALGARPLSVDAAAHDRLVAISSHLPQVVSVMLGAQLASAGDGDDRVYELCGPGMQSMLRLARSEWALWSPIVQANATALGDAMATFSAALQATAGELANGKLDGLVAAFEEAHRAVNTLEEGMKR